MEGGGGVVQCYPCNIILVYFLTTALNNIFARVYDRRHMKEVTELITSIKSLQGVQKNYYSCNVHNIISTYYLHVFMDTKLLSGLILSQ